jgi:hypothetical protein
MASDPQVPIHPDEVPAVFSTLAVARIASDAGLSLGTGSQLRAVRERLANGVRASVREYAVAARRMSPNAVRREIEDLARAADTRDYEKVLRLWEQLSVDARHLLQRRADNALNMWELRAQGRQRFAAKTGTLLREPPPLIVTLPTADDLRDPGRRAAACDAIFRLAVTGRGCDWEWSDHESHASDQDSFDGLTRSDDRPDCIADKPDIPDDPRCHKPRRLRLNAPEPSRKEPRRAAERELCRSLEMDCYVVTGRMPPRTARHEFAGPIDRFIAECLRRAGAPASEKDHDRRGLVVQLRNDSAPVRKRAALTREWRCLLGPWCEKYALVDEVRRLLELGEATILRIPIGADEPKLPLESAVLNFEEQGTICFWRPPFGYRTITVERPLRQLLMDLAERLNALNAQERRVRERRAAASKTRRSAGRAQNGRP